MKLKKKLILLCLLTSFAAYGQTDTTEVIYYDTTSIREMEMIDEPYPMLEDVAMPAVPYDEYIEYNPVNKFKHNKKIKPEEKPDKKAVYTLGTGELLRQISNRLSVPYGYGGEDQYVILQFVVGKDSVLYNPEILFSPGTEYSINATNVIEQLQDKFVPATKNGKPVDTIIIIPIRFKQRPNNEYRYRNRYR